MKNVKNFKVDGVKRSVLKDGKPLMADISKGSIRIFKNIHTARQFVFNLLNGSTKLTIDNFEFIKVGND